MIEISSGTTIVSDLIWAILMTSPKLKNATVIDHSTDSAITPSARRRRTMNAEMHGKGSNGFA